MRNRPPFLGLLRLDTSFPRPLGDLGQPRTWQAAGLPVRVRVVPQASAQRVVLAADPLLLGPFVAAAQQLQAAGAVAIVTSCGFLARDQDALQAAVQVPVLSSALLWCQALSAPGILTFDAPSLNAAVRAGARVPHNTPVEGLQAQDHLRQVILHNARGLSRREAERNVVSAAQRLVQAHPQVRQIVLECTNMPPYRDAVAQATGRPVHDLLTLVQARQVLGQRAKIGV